MAFWKMAGFEVTPTIPSSIIFWSPPFSMSSRESSSTQGACPSSRILAKRSFTCSLLSEPFCRDGSASRPFSLHLTAGQLVSTSAGQLLFADGLRAEGPSCLRLEPCARHCHSVRQVLLTIEGRRPNKRDHSPGSSLFPKQTKTPPLMAEVLDLGGTRR